ncbi:MAG: hypothetical protein LBK61_03710 [Spirochaetaceae bacterium]|jgi:hypothetical protein|nr:hypothetical protein [Spirochaetaceae bacterium]
MSYGKRYNMKTALAPLALLLVLSGCPQPEGGGTPFELSPEIPRKLLMTNNTPVEAVCYVDAEQHNPLNAKDYIFAATADTAETQFFNYVVLGHADLARNERGYMYLKMTPAIEHILANTKTYIKPLHQKGIKVLLEVRSGGFSATDNGDRLGWGTMDMAAIVTLTRELKRIVNHYGLDGFEFNDAGGGLSAYPPLTRYLTRSTDGGPLYPDELFEDDNGDPLKPDEIEAKLWIEGGSNFSNLIQVTNEALKESGVSRVILVRNTGHGSHLLSSLRMAYMPDAYSGADPKVIGNLRYIVNATPYDGTTPHASLLDELQNKDVGEDADDQYVPFAIDLADADKKDKTTAESWADTFLFNGNNPNKYGALYVTNLGPASETNNYAAYLTYFSQKLFGRNVRLAETPGAGKYEK